MDMQELHFDPYNATYVCCTYICMYIGMCIKDYLYTKTTSIELS